MEQDKNQGLSIASMVLGIVSLVSWFIWPVSTICAIIGLIFGFIRIKQVKYKGMAIAGLVTSIISLSLWVIILLFSFVIVGAVL